MPNKDYEQDNGSGLPQRVKGPKGSPAEFKEFRNPDGAGDDNRSDPNGSGVKMPQDSTKKLPQAGKTQ